MTTIIETFTSVPLIVTLQHCIDAVKAFTPIVLLGLATYLTLRTK
jgi:hypothetical protein